MKCLLQFKYEDGFPSQRRIHRWQAIANGKDQSYGGSQTFYQKTPTLIIMSNKMKLFSCNVAHEINQKGRQHVCAYF